MTGKLARVRWRMGQTLLPDHFVAQEDAFFADSALRFRLRGLPAHGVASLKWNDALLAQGVLSISAATIVMPSGLLVEIAGNAQASPLNLNVPGGTSVSAYLHLLEKGAEDADDHSNGVVPRLVHQLALSADQSLVGAIETIKLAELRKDPEGLWQLSGRWVPPLVMVGRSPFLSAELDELASALEGFEYKLVLDSASYMSGSGLYTVKNCLKAVYRTRRLLANLKGQIFPHPYHLYEALKDFYVEVCFYRDAAPKDIADPYNHDQLAQTFDKVLSPLREQMQLAEKKSPYTPFSLRDGIYRVELPPEVKQARDVYFLIQKNQLSRTVQLRDFKMASLSRLPMVHRLALQGIPLQRIDRPSLAHSFGPEVEFHQIVLGEDWDGAVREGVVAFYDRPDFAELEFYLYWYAG